MHGRLVWGSNGRTANVVGFVNRRSTTKDVPFAVRADAAPGLENRRTSSTIASRGSWQSPLGGAIAGVGVHRGAARHAIDAADERPAGAPGRRHRRAHRIARPRAGGRTHPHDRRRCLDWRTARMGGHDVRVGGDIERTQVSERASFSGGEFFHDVAGRPDTVDVWLGSDRETHLGREAVFVTDTWTPARRLAISAGLRAAHLSGGAYGTTSVQPRVGATLAVDEAARLVARASAGVVADPLYATHVDRTVGGETRRDHVRDPPRRTPRRDRRGPTPTLAGVAGGIRHPQARELSAGADFRLSRRGAGGRHDLRPAVPRCDRHGLSRRAMAGAGAPGPGRPARHDLSLVESTARRRADDRRRRRHAPTTAPTARRSASPPPAATTPASSDTSNVDAAAGSRIDRRRDHVGAQPRHDRRHARRPASDAATGSRRRRRR